MTTRSDDISADATAFTDAKENTGKKNENTSNATKTKPSSTSGEKTLEQHIDEAMETVNKATAFFDTPAFERAAAAQANQYSRQPAYTYQAPGRTGGSQFNIIGGTIGQAAIGNTGDVTFNQEQKVYQRGAQHTNFDISGGNFAQANIGGTAQYNNDGTKITAGDAGVGGGKAYFTPEQLTLHILERGVTCQELGQLLDQQYTLVNLAFAMPREPMKRNNMVKALLDGGNAMEVN